MSKPPPVAAGPEPRRANNLDGLAQELGLLRARAAYGSHRAKVSLDDLARRVGQPRSSVHVYVTGQRLAPAEVLDAIVIALGATPAEQRDWSEAWFRVSAHDSQRHTGLPTTARPPRQLPMDVDGFTGRIAELAQLDASLTGADRATTAMVISAVTGTGGVGKTALAVHWAHRSASAFPDGQLWVDLRGYGPDQSVEPIEALAGFLRSLGVDGRDIPFELEERAARYRSLLDGRRMLVLLDNARDYQQVRPLLPGSSSCRVLVTSRDSLVGLVARHGARRIDLDLLPHSDATGLLRQLIGGRVDIEPGAASTVVWRCARLPLALRIAAEFAAAHPAAALVELAGELADERRRLDLLDAADDPRTAVRAVFSWSYQHLGDDVARVFRLGGLHPGPHFAASAMAALADVDHDQARRILGTLVRAHLVHEVRPGRFAMHDLLRAWAVERCTTDDTAPDRRTALTRLFDHYVHTAAMAMDRLYPHEQHRRPTVAAPATIAISITDPAAARCWLDSECDNMLAIAVRADGDEGSRQTVALSATLARYLGVAGRNADAQALHENAVTAARRSNDLPGQARALKNLGNALLETGRSEMAMTTFQQSLAIFCEIGDLGGQASVMSNLGRLHEWCSRYQQAVERHLQALALFDEMGDLAGQASTLNNLGIAYARTGRYRESTETFQRVLSIAGRIGRRDDEAGALNNLGMLSQRLGQYENATGQLAKALALFRKIGHRDGEARTLDSLGTVHERTGRYQQAVEYHEHALSIFLDIGDPAGQAETLTGLGVVYRRIGQHQQSAHHHTQAMALFRELGDLSGQAAASNGLGETASATGRSGQALVAHQEALRHAGTAGDNHQLARSHDGLGQAHQSLGDPERAAEHWRAALALYAKLGAPEADHVRARLSNIESGVST